MAITTIGLDTSKSWFQEHGVDDGQAVLRRKLLPFFASLRPCTIGLAWISHTGWRL
jgi:transposase